MFWTILLICYLVWRSVRKISCFMSDFSPLYQIYVQPHLAPTSVSQELISSAESVLWEGFSMKVVKMEECWATWQLFPKLKSWTVFNNRSFQKYWDTWPILASLTLLSDVTMVHHCQPWYEREWVVVVRRADGSLASVSLTQGSWGYNSSLPLPRMEWMNIVMKSVFGCLEKRYKGTMDY